MKQVRRICGSEVGGWLQYHDSGDSSGKGGNQLVGWFRVDWAGMRNANQGCKSSSVAGIPIRPLVSGIAGGEGEGEGGNEGGDGRELKYVGRGRN